jgi:hypothetical protein
MNQLAKRQSTALDTQFGGMLKKADPGQFKELLAGYLLKCIKLNMEPLPDPEALGGIVDELYLLLQRSWPGVRPGQVWLTLKAGMGKSGQYRVRINYPTVANWLLYHKVTSDEPTSQVEKEMAPSLNTQSADVLAGLKKYREAVARGEYKPRGRE